MQGTNATDNTLLGERHRSDDRGGSYGFWTEDLHDCEMSGPDKRYFRVTNFVMPNLSAFGGSTVGDGYSVHWHVPIDDTHHWKYVFMFSRTKPLDPELRNKSRAELTADYRLPRAMRPTATNRTASR